MKAQRRRSTALIVTALLLNGACKGTLSEASLVVPGTGVRVTVKRVAIHQFLAEYTRRLVVEHPGRPVAELDMDLDSGGAQHIKVYRVGEGLLRMRDRFGSYEIDLGGRITSLGTAPVPSGAVFLGAFDNDADGLAGVWRFIPVAERPERHILGDTSSQ